MSLVAYTASSDEDSDCELSTETIHRVPVKRTTQNSTTIEQQQQNGQKQQPQKQEPSKSMNLPQPKNIFDDNEIDTSTSDNTPDFIIKLPAPKQSQSLVNEADDEFLHKKVDPSLIERPTDSTKSRKSKAGTRQPVKITIPSLAEFSTADTNSVTSNAKPFSVGANPKKSCGLLSLLPPPKFNGIFSKPKEKSDSTMPTTTTTTVSIVKTTSLIPHSVSKRQAAINSKPSTIQKKSSNLGLNYNSDDSDAGDDACEDFFSLNAETKLPEVSAAEINAMVAKKTNRMAEFSRSLNNEQQHTTVTTDAHEYAQPVSQSSTASDRDQINIEALIGARAAKRSRKNDIQFIDIRQDQVTSSNDEWMRNRLQSETELQPTGRLITSDQPGSGTKKKHQITYLAYQAKANEAELQAMWATNRQSRRQTQSKYGF